MPLNRKVIWKVGITLAVLVNLWGSLPTDLKRMRSPVGEGPVFVYAPRGGRNENSVAVMTWDGKDENDTNGKFVATGQTVVVYLRTDYLASYPRYTLLILGITILLHYATGLRLFNRGQCQPSRNI
jgi:hypothetical protein